MKSDHVNNNELHPPRFTKADVRYAEDPAMFARAEGLWKSGKVVGLRDMCDGYEAVVRGTQSYHVFVSDRAVDRGSCDCYMGLRDELCKHMLAVAIAVLELSGQHEEDMQAAPTNLPDVKKQVAPGMRKVRSYSGSSRQWFAYQRTLAVGAGTISEAVSALPPSPAHAKYLWQLVLRLCKKLATGGVDDSNGIVGECVRGLVIQLTEYVQVQPDLRPLVLSFCKDDTGFGFEEELRSQLEK